MIATGKTQFYCFTWLSIFMLFSFVLKSQTYADLPDIGLNAPLPEKLKIIDENSRFGKIECYADDSILLDRIARKAVWVHDLEISKRFHGTESGLEKLKKLPRISSLGLYSISFSVIHHVLVNVPEDSLHSLRLSHCSLDSIDSYIAVFRNLVSLNLFTNNLLKWPAVIDKLPALTELDLSGNNLVECRPVNPHLKKLYIQNNHLVSGSIKLINAAELEEIDFSENSIEVLPGDIGKHCPRLKSINVNNNRLEDFPLSLTHCDALHSIAAHKNNISVFPGVLLQLKTLWNLDAGYNRLGSLPQSICRLKQLQRLDISGNFLETLPDSLYFLPALRELHTEGNLFIKTPGVILRIIDENKNMKLKEGEEVSAFPRILLTQNLIFSDKSSYRPLQSPYYNPDSLTLEIQDHFPQDFRFFGYTKKIIFSGIKDSLWPAAVIQCYSMPEEIIIRNCVADTSALSGYISVQTRLQEIAIQNCGIGSFSANIKWPGTLTGIDLGNNFLEALPMDFCKLPDLKYVDIHNNRLKVIPDCLIGKLRL